MELFWRKGYQDTTITDLTEHLGIGSPSLYAAFGSKSELFREVADRYQLADAAPPLAALETADTARDAIEGVLRGNAALFTRRGRPRGCLLTRARLTVPEDEAALLEYLERTRRERLSAISDRLERAAAAGERLPGGDLRAVAAHYDALIQGLAVAAIEGGSRRDLAAVVDVAMTAWDASVAAAPARVDGR
jgi:AcrR family transcriptional regulator